MLNNETLPNIHPDFDTIMRLWDDRIEYLDDDSEEVTRDVECEVYDRITLRMECDGSAWDEEAEDWWNYDPCQCACHMPGWNQRRDGDEACNCCKDANRSLPKES